METAAESNAPLPTWNLCDECSKFDLVSPLFKKHNCDLPFEDPYGDYECSVATTIGVKGSLDSWSIDSCSLCAFLAKLIGVGNSPCLAGMSEASQFELAYDCSHVLEDGYHAYTRWLHILGPQTLLCIKSGEQEKYIAVCAKGSRLGYVRCLEENSIDFTIIQRWLDHCQNFHENGKYKCAVLETQGRVPINLHMIDCDTFRIVPALQEKYVAMSYVWGQTSENLQFSERLPTTLPPTIQDAITVTKSLGFRYIWIDRYCIDQGNKADAQVQINQMDLIYQEASLTLVAASGKDPSYGLPGVSQCGRRQQLRTEIGDLLLIDPLENTQDEIAKYSVWSSRGWTYQEASLSRRLLIFAEDQVYFECRAMCCFEVINLHPSQLQVLFLEDLWRIYSQRKRDWSPARMQQYRSKYFQEMSNLGQQIRVYSEKNFTYPSDRLNGFLGILASMEPHGILHWYGVPIFPLQNDWNDSTTEKRRSQILISFSLYWNFDSPQQEHLRIENLPSWSWAGWTGGVRTLDMDLLYEEDLQTDVKFELVDRSIIDPGELLERYSEIREKQLGSPFIHITRHTLSMAGPPQKDPNRLRCRFEMIDGSLLGLDFHISDSIMEVTIKVSYKAIILGKYDSGPNIQLFVLLLGDAGNGLERIDGNWFSVDEFDYPYLCTWLNPDLTLCGTLEQFHERYGRDKWYKCLKSTQETHCIG